MTDYLRPMVDYVATQTGHCRGGDGHPGQAKTDRVTALGSGADTTEDTPDRGWTR